MKNARRASSSFADPPEPVREELWSAERLGQHALSLAERQRVRPGRWGDRWLGPRLRENGRVLLASYRTMAGALRDERASTTAAEGRVANLHIVGGEVGGGADCGLRQCWAELH